MLACKLLHSPVKGLEASLNTLLILSRLPCCVCAQRQAEEAAAAAAASERRAVQAEARALEVEAQRDGALDAAKEASAAAAAAARENQSFQAQLGAEAARCRSDAAAAEQVRPTLLDGVRAT